MKQPPENLRYAQKRRIGFGGLMPISFSPQSRKCAIISLHNQIVQRLYLELFEIQRVICIMRLTGRSYEKSK